MAAAEAAPCNRLQSSAVAESKRLDCSEIPGNAVAGKRPDLIPQKYIDDLRKPMVLEIKGLHLEVNLFCFKVLI